MQTLNDALYQLYVTRQVSADECVRTSSDPNEFLRMIGKGPGEDISGAPNDRRATDRALVGGMKR
jgi:twitching motility protein PilT